MHRRNIVLALLLLLLSAVPSIAASVDGGYMLSQASYLVYIRLNQDGKNLKGYVQVVQADDLAANGMSVRKFDLNGTVNGTKVALDIGGGLFGLIAPQQIDGAVNGKRLTLHMPVATGEITTSNLTAVSNDQWNDALHRFSAKRLAARFNQQSYNALNARLNNLYKRFNDGVSRIKTAERTVQEAERSLKKAKSRQGSIKKKNAKIEVELKAAREELEVLNAKANETQTGEDASKVSEAQVHVWALEIDLSGATVDRPIIEREITDLKATIDTNRGILNLLPSQLNAISKEFYLPYNSSLSGKDKSKPFVMYTVEALQAGGTFSQPDTKSVNMFSFNKGIQMTAFPTGGGWYAIVMTSNNIGWIEASKLKQVKPIQ